MLTPVQAAAHTHDAKKMFRLTVPLVARVLHLQREGLLALQMLLGVGLLYLLISVLYRGTADKLLTTLVTLLCCSCYFCYSAFYDVFGRVDAFGYFLLLLAIWLRHPLAVGGAVFAASFCDERAFIGSWFVFVYWLLFQQQGGMKNRLSLSPQHYGIVLAWVGYVAARLFLTYRFGFQTPTAGTGLAIFKESRLFTPLAVFSTYGLAWLPILAAAVLLVYYQRWLLLGLLTTGFVASLVAAVLVQDINRSLAYSFPLLLISLLILYNSSLQTYLRRAVALTLLMSCLVPIYTYDSHLHYIPNLLIRLVEVASR